MNKLAELDHRYVWHPFTQMQDWLSREPIILVEGNGAVVRDHKGQEYLDANSSIWTNLHGHNHPKINRAIERQLKKIAHSSALGLANEPASLLAEKLVQAANPTLQNPCAASGSPAPPFSLQKVFFSDDGSTAMEVALKLAYEFSRRTGRSKSPRFLSLEGGYHGDTLGAVSLGHIDLFHNSYCGLLFESDSVISPYCYRCPFNRAQPERHDARQYRKCDWECVGLVEKKFRDQKKKGNPYAALVVEPLMQGAAGMIPQPHGWLRRVAEIARDNGAQLIADEVMTAFGRTGGVEDGKTGRREDGKTGTRGHEGGSERFQSGQNADFLAASSLRPETGRGPSRSPVFPFSRLPSSLFACHGEGVQPDFLAVAKGLTGGYLPMAATLTTKAVFDAFLGDYSEFKAFFHGHSFTGNQLGSAAALASLEILESPASIRARQTLGQNLREQLQTLWSLPNVGDIRQEGLIAGIELVKDWRTRAPFDLRERAGIRVCEAMAKRGVLTRPIGNVIVLMPPYCTTDAQARKMVKALHEAIRETVEQ